MRILRERGREKRDKRDKRERKEGKERRKREEREKRALGCFGCQGSWHFKASKASLSVRKAFLIKIREQNCMFEAT